MPIRKIISIDEDLCIGCGQCIVDCAEGALEIVDGKAKLVRESHCDGLGACIGNCPTGALTLIEREAPEFELPGEGAAYNVPNTGGAMNTEIGHKLKNQSNETNSGHTGCPGAQSRQFTRVSQETSILSDCASALSHWPIQLHLVNFDAPQFQGVDLLLAADCSAFACGEFHSKLLKGKSLVIACPKLDNPAGYLEKLCALLQRAKPKSVSVVRMEVPCCRGITQWILQARQQSGADTPIEEVIISIEGEIRSRNVL